jgi:glycosyltransferase involved in cell wall biosynthesis
VHVHAQPERLRATLDSIAARTPPVELILLPDGPDEQTVAALQALPSVPQLATPRPLGAPACFNRFTRATVADVLVLLESGSVVGPEWLERLLAALDEDPRNGLAGPSTNRSWNEQGAFPRAAGGDDNVSRTAAEAAGRFGSTSRSLEPLYSLADFCYAVRHEVVAAIGEADERYGLGPCWEMDYAVRAARAGFRAVWACGAYVYRAPFTPRRAHEERARFEANRQLYQNKFCALRLRGEPTAYEPHCRGNECEHFAPAGLIEVVRRSSPTQPQAPSPASIAWAPDREPLASCIMPTRDRGDFVLQAIRYFQRQDYEERELIILDDGDGSLERRLPPDSRIRYARMAPGQSIGAKRNRGCELARGRVIVHWDDDDWYGSSRLRTQVAPLIAGEADITGLTADVFFVLPRWEFWRCSPELHRRLFTLDVHGGTLAFLRRVWEGGARYPHTSLAEDALFLRNAVRRGARLVRQSGEGLFIYLRHESNAWRFACGEYLDRSAWLRVLEPPMLGSDREFYATRSWAAPKQGLTPLPAFDTEAPLVSCIMPTANRRPFMTQAIRYFLRQDYPRRELIIVDDGDDAIEDLVPPDSRIRYVRRTPRQLVGSKRNVACEVANGSIILHWDDDDWMATRRVAYQVHALVASPAAQVCGLTDVLFYEPGTRRAWRYVYGTKGRPWLSGNTLCYRKALWQRTSFPAVNEGEDTRFVWSVEAKSLLALADPTFFVGMVHPRNTSPKRIGDARWQPLPAYQLRALLGEDVGFYDGTSILRPDECSVQATATAR